MPTPYRETPPEALLLECPDPIMAFKKNGDLAEAIVALRDTLAKCNLDKRALRDWAESK